MKFPSKKQGKANLIAVSKQQQADGVILLQQIPLPMQQNKMKPVAMKPNAIK